jgi:carboxyl-terminal processing protease
MSNSLRWFGLAMLSIGLSLPVRAAMADATDGQKPVSADTLETQAVDALHQGEFDRGSELFAEAATAEPELRDLAKWTADFNTEEHGVEAERQTEFEKNVKDIHLLIDHHMQTYAIDAVAQAYLRAPDKDKFRAEKWVNDQINSAIADAQQAEDHEKWLTALRIYSDLAGVDPYKPEWKQKLKLSTRRIRLLATYAPDAFKVIEKPEMAARKEADELLHPTTQPSPDASEEDDDSDFKTDWHDVVHGINFDMLMDALVYAKADYFRDVTMQKLLHGGFDGLRTLVTTKGLEQTFTALADEKKKADFLADVDAAEDQVRQLTPDNEELGVHDCLETLLDNDHETVNIPDEVFISEFADGALDQLDPFSNMIWPYEEAEFNQMTQGEFIGVGIEIESAPDGSLRVASPLEDTPAYKSGIRAGDIITKIDGKNAHGISLTQAVKTITGPAHTSVMLTIRSPDGTVKNHNIERKTINVVSVKGYTHRPGGGWDYFVDPKSKIAYLRITNFTQKTGDELTDALDELQREGAQGLILDLRYNPGGLLDAAVKVASQFVRDGVIVSTHPDRVLEDHPPTVNDAEPDMETTDMPLAVLVNQYSASASEIVSGALKDHHRATIVGERTFGKGSVQVLMGVAQKEAYLKLTISHYYLPSGRCLHREENSTVWGVDPDVAVELTPEQMQKAIDARKDVEVLRDVDPAATQPATAAQDNLLSADPQLAAALMVIRLKLAGVAI